MKIPQIAASIAGYRLTEETQRQEERARYHLRCLKKLRYPTLAAK
jgi:hypothetical protein